MKKKLKFCHFSYIFIDFYLMIIFSRSFFNKLPRLQLRDIWKYLAKYIIKMAILFCTKKSRNKNYRKVPFNMY